MIHPLRYLGFVVFAVAAGVVAERAVSVRRAVDAELLREARANQTRLLDLEARRMARLEAEADLVRDATLEARREASRNARWSTRPVPRAPGDAEPVVKGDEAEATRPAPRRSGALASKGVREAVRAIGDGIAPASRGAGASGVAPSASEIDAPSADEKPEERKPGVGLRGEYWKLVDQELRDFPDIEKKLPLVVRVDPAIDFVDGPTWRLPWMARNVAVRWRGYLFAEVDGIYTLSVTSDDGMVLVIDGTTIIDNGGLHSPQTKTVDTYLFEGFHSIEVRYFQNEGAAVAQLSWVPMRGEPGPIPKEVLYPADLVRASQAPVIEDVLPKGARSGQPVVIRGTGFPAPSEPVEATFGGIDMRAEALPDGTIRATLPPGVDRAQILVRVRDRTSLGFAYESGDVFGLLGVYTPSDGGAPIRSLVDMPRIATSETFRRVEPAVAFYSPASFALPFAPARFGARLHGSICVHESGPYRWKLTSDDGSRLSIGGDLVVDVDGLHGMTSAESSTFLAAGLHDVVVEYFNNDGGGGLILEWMPPGHTRFSVVPRKNLYPPLLSGRYEPPDVLSVEPSPVTVGEALTIDGDNFTGDARQDRVLLNGVPLEVEFAGLTRMVVRVPHDARAGSIVVQAGELVSKPFPIQVRGRGLNGAYYKLDEDVTSLPETSGLAPAFERVDASLRFGEAFSFALPFAPERFAAEWRGFIEIPYAGAYKFKVWSDDGSRLTVAGRTVVENDGIHGFTGVSGEVELPLGRHPISLRYFQALGHAALDVWWAPPGKPSVRIPEEILFPERP